ncbi:hypothetical protein [Paenibacillus montanisoli]|uniref:Uncharacterized protein n=1 Tax=Paenibacillus montanisoli TaxID=2081970 RepID=A0A328U295_9BACL|nr:hypothetical protein [Paenibacillus montanisoli]RAP76800.1 hypothetical protein DL346_15795 [Paenibacillus montanisoli]
MSVRSRTKTSSSAKRPAIFNTLFKSAPRKTKADKTPKRVSGHRYAKLFHKPRAKRDIEVDPSVWKKIIASVPVDYQLPDVDVLKKLHAMNRQQEGNS